MADGTGTTRGGTSYLPAGRESPEGLARELAAAARSPVVDALLRGGAGALAVLDAHRQLVALNAAALELAGVESPADALGLRPGEALRCVHADEGADGCGTGPACASCGAAVAQLVAGHRGRIAERDCHLSVRAPGGLAVDRVLRVRAAPLEVEGHAFLLLAFADVTAARRREGLERAFLHDLGNLAAGLAGAAGTLRAGAPREPEAIADVQELADELVSALRLQRLLLAERPERSPAAHPPVTLAALVEGVRRAAEHHPAAVGRRLLVTVQAPEGATVSADPVLVRHVVVNMLVNALEATRAGGEVRLAVEAGGGGASFRVWNEGAIPAAVIPRLFQRHFTTKPGAGRGEGTHAMKLFGEGHLGGAVGFTTSAAEGTWFELRLPAG